MHLPTANTTNMPPVDKPLATVMKPKLLIIDDDDRICTQMKWALNEEYEVLLANDRPAALQSFDEHEPPVVLLDLGLPPSPGTPDEGFEAMAQMLARNRFVKIIVISGQSEKLNALRAIGSGAYDFVTKPLAVEELRVILKRTYHLARLERSFHELQQQVGSEGFEGMLGTSPQMQQVFSSVRKVAGSDAPVLLLGESGTGKEKVARSIHWRGPRKDGPFVVINCGAIPEALLESELFGHERGAFTGAHMQRKGKVEMASGGTLFLDEIGELPTLLQVKLLRFLQEQRIERVGGRQEIQVDVRVVAATNVDLQKAIAEGRFREDLFYRLAVVVIKLPPLRERENDIRYLAEAFLRRAEAQGNKNGLAFSREALRVMHEHPWPGNVRELENRVRRAVIMADRKYLSAEDLELTGVRAAPQWSSLKEAREALEREMIERALRKHSWKIAPAAGELNISRPTLYELMERLGIKKPR
jgi:two-component system, NtrC family, response regulator